MHETSILPKDRSVPEQHDPEDHQTVDTLATSSSDGAPLEVVEVSSPSQIATAPEEAQGPDAVASAPEEAGKPGGVPEHAAMEEAAAQTPHGPTAGPIEDPTAENGFQATDAATDFKTRVSAWPFITYVGIWLAAVVGAGWLLVSTTPAGVAVFATETYRIVVLAGVGLTALGPILSLVVWLAVLAKTRGRSHAGALSGSLVRGALATLCGVALWWAMLLIVDTLRLGRPL
jgi:uncharacterized membrane protein YhaH (DUF805 family)